MFQDPALFPHRTVFENIAYAPLLQRRPRAEVEREVTELVHLVRLNGLDDRLPEQLSGGERQRVALARTLAARPQVVLFDEPFAAIDVELKAELRAEFRAVLRARGAAGVHVTHDRDEGLFLGDRVGLLFGGRLGPLAPPAQRFGAPGDERAARFLGYNVIQEGRLAVHPTDVRWTEPGAGSVHGTVLVSGRTGSDALAVVRLDDGSRVEVRSRADTPWPRPGEPVGLSWSRAIALGPLPSGTRTGPKSPKAAEE
jgi:ABC-type sulfate/molybdate transport systems ATPase subunit